MLDFETLASINEDWQLLEDAKMRLEEELVIRRSRPTMISAKYRAREERRRLLKISAGKLRRIEDPEASLCRSVLINNAVRRLQRENRDEKTRNYGIPVVAYLDDSAKENSIGSGADGDASQRKRLGDEVRNENSSPKKLRTDDLDLQDDVFSDFYILPPTPRLLSHIDDAPDSPNPLDYPETRLNSNPTDNRPLSAATSTTAGSVLFSGDLTDNLQLSPLRTTESRLFSADPSMMDVVCDEERITEFARFADTAKTLEERLVDFQSLDEHFDLSKFERNNNHSCGRAFHDIQTFHSLVPGLET